MFFAGTPASRQGSEGLFVTMEPAAQTVFAGKETPSSTTQRLANQQLDIILMPNALIPEARIGVVVPYL